MEPAALCLPRFPSAPSTFPSPPILTEPKRLRISGMVKVCCVCGPIWMAACCADDRNAIIGEMRMDPRSRLLRLSIWLAVATCAMPSVPTARACSCASPQHDSSRSAFDSRESASCCCGERATAPTGCCCRMSRSCPCGDDCHCADPVEGPRVPRDRCHAPETVRIVGVTATERLTNSIYAPKWSFSAFRTPVPISAAHRCIVLCRFIL